jgi:hypothetical protein
MLTESQIESIKVARLEPGDVLVLKCQQAASKQAAASVMGHVRQLLPDGVTAMLLDGGMDIEVLRKVGADAAAS